MQGDASELGVFGNKGKQDDKMGQMEREGRGGAIRQESMWCESAAQASLP